MRWLWCLALLALAACEFEGGTLRRGDGGALAADGGDEQDEGAQDDLGPSDAGGDACVPLACPPEACGPRPDGCGAVLDCDAGCGCQGDGCACEADADCPARPCEVATCADGDCAYAPVTCGGECTCDAEACDDATPRRCGEGCGAQFCDPSPDGRGGYLNRCVPVEALPCGACGVATSACDPESGAITCDDLIAVEDAQGRPCEQLVLFVDPAYEGPQRGTRQAPFHDLGAALDLAALADVRLVALGGSGELVGPVTLRDGIEVRGGYTSHPFFQPSADRPTLRAVATPQAVADGQMVAVHALGVTTGSALRGVDVVVDAPPAPPPGVSENGTAGTHTVGVLAVDSPALVLDRVQITVAAAGPGVPGAEAAPVVADLDPALMDGPAGLQAPGRVASGRCEEVGDQIFARFQDFEQPCGNPDPIGPFLPGARGAWGAVCPADVDGVRSRSAPGGAAGNLLMLCRGLAGGERPPWPEDQINRRAGAPGQVGGALDALGRWRALGSGQPGLPGVSGRPGAGGSSTHDEGCQFGASGGGGGAGGCGGFGGRPGGGGGSALGVLAIRSPGLTLIEVTGTVGAGGAGAPGGLGSAGLPGGAGGAPGLDAYGGPSAATPGEAGGAGHPGGPGGNGAGGDSVGVLCLESAVDVPEGAFTVGEAGAGAAAHADRNAAPAPAGRAGAQVGCGP